MSGGPIAIGDLMPLILARVRAAINAHRAEKCPSAKPKRVKGAAL